VKIPVAVTVLKGVKVALAFPPPAWVAPGMGDALLARLRPHFPAVPVMLVALHRNGVRAHADFQAQALVEGSNADALGRLDRVVVDLDVPPALPDAPAPF
jgi:hypothetical protein